jgi:hypothetical protein
MKIFSSLSLAVILCMLLALPVAADTILYDNGPYNGTLKAWTIHSPFAVSNSFTLSQSSVVAGADFVVWMRQTGDAMTSVDWKITSSPFDGATIASGTAAPSGVFLISNVNGYNAYTESIAIAPSVALSANTYWFELENGVTGNKDLVFWDINNGPSAAYENTLGNVNGHEFPGTNSDSFRIYGSNSVVVEPTSLLLLGAGLSAIGLATWRKRK